MAGLAAAASGSRSTNWNVTPDPPQPGEGRELRLPARRRRGHLAQDQGHVREKVFPATSPTPGYPPRPARRRVIGIFKEEDRRTRGTWAPGRDRPALQKIVDKHPSVGEVRGLGVFWCIELVKGPRDARGPSMPFNASGPGQADDGSHGRLQGGGVWPFAHFNRLRATPPLMTSGRRGARRSRGH